MIFKLCYDAFSIIWCPFFILICSTLIFIIFSLLATFTSFFQCQTYIPLHQTRFARDKHPGGGGPRSKMFSIKIVWGGFWELFYILIYKFWEYFRGGAHFISSLSPFIPLQPPSPPCVNVWLKPSPYQFSSESVLPGLI
jgi:hypothetical protein